MNPTPLLPYTKEAATHPAQTASTKLHFGINKINYISTKLPYEVYYL